MAGACALKVGIQRLASSLENVQYFGIQILRSGYVLLQWADLRRRCVPLYPIKAGVHVFHVPNVFTF